MLVILEGPDGSGKSTLARDLEELILTALPNDRIDIIHSGPPKMHPLDEYERSLTDYRPGTGRHLILDRWHWGEYVYPELFERGPAIDAVYWWHIERYLQRLGAVVVACTQYADAYRDVYRQRGSKDAYVASILLQVERKFSWARRMSVLPVLDYNWQSPANGNQHAIIERAVTEEGRASVLNEFTTYVGPTNPQVLLFGDVRHRIRDGYDPDNKQKLDPAFVPFQSTSGNYLIESLFAGEFDGHHLNDESERFGVGLANACDVDDWFKLWVTLGNPRIVTLGRNARRAVHDGLAEPTAHAGYVQHPQFIRRFYHNQMWLYGQMIRDAAATGGDHTKWHESLRDAPARKSTSRSSKRSAVTAASATAATVPS